MHSISFRGIRTHNLKNFDLTLTHRKFYVVTGVSGSGKSSLAFDSLYAEGQRRYVESISSYARQFLEQMEKPDIDQATGVLPSLAIEAKNTVNNARSTVGTQTEVNDFLRLFFSRIAKPVCRDCKDSSFGISAHSAGEIQRKLCQKYSGQKAAIFFPLKIPSNNKKDRRSYFEELIRQGFEFVRAKDDWMSIDDFDDAGKEKRVYIQVDQLKISQKSKTRILEALELAYEKGRGYLGLRIDEKDYWFSKKNPICSSCGKVYKKPSPHLFSFNSPMGACKECQGFGRVITLDSNLVIPDENKSLKEGAIEPWTKESTKWEYGELLDFCKRKKIPTTVPWKKLTKKQKEWLWQGHPDDDFVSIEAFFEYLQKKTYKMHIRIFLNRYRGYSECDVCHGSRLIPEALSYEIEGRNIADYQNDTIGSLYEKLRNMKLRKVEHQKAGAVYDELLSRVGFLYDVGLHYLTLSRMSRTLSGGEVQRIHLASSLGAALVDTLYVLDEPSIGLHERDNEMLINLLYKLRDLGNTVVVVEHDRTMIESADEVIDLGPQGGELGGRLLFQGSVEELLKCENSLTADFLSGKKTIERRNLPDLTPKNLKKIIIREAASHNLKGFDVEFPLNQLVVLTGVSGAGKSTLLYNVLYAQYQKFRGRAISADKLGQVKSIQGFKNIQDVVLVDQSPIGRSPRSNAASYLKIFDEIRKLFSKSPEAQRKKLGPGSFSFNTQGGRCEKCQGDGQVKIEMHFLADVYVTCEACSGKRFKKEILEIYYRGKNIDQVLNLTIHEAIEFFADKAAVKRKLQLLEDVGLGYIKLGQSTLTLSGGEGQRLKLAGELGSRRQDKILYLFDEPTTGLHESDISYLMKSFEKLLAGGHSIIVIEHHLEMIRNADYVIDMGPEGGSSGGDIVYQGDIKGLLRCKSSHTGKWLKKYLS